MSEPNEWLKERMEHLREPRQWQLTGPTPAGIGDVYFVEWPDDPNGVEVYGPFPDKRTALAVRDALNGRSAPPQEPDKFRHIAALGENWDSYGAHPIAPAAIAAARNFLDWGLTGYVSVVPSSDSGVQLEWHYSGADIEVRFAPDGSVSAFAENAGEGSAPPSEPESIEAIRSDEAVRDAFVECYTLQGIVAVNGMNVTPEQIADWDRVESALIRAILARAGVGSAPRETPEDQT